VVIVLAHWGIEYEDAPRPNVIAAAHAMVEAGATAVIGDHPHWVQSVERYRGAYIAYGVGNFIFDQMWSAETREGSLHELWFAGDRLVAVRIRPTLIEDFYRPRLLGPGEPAFRAVLDRIYKHSSF
jgi:poly-gamma-glutamate synthesis protein (capsule biosynthesis protein)